MAFIYSASRNADYVQDLRFRTRTNLNLSVKIQHDLAWRKRQILARIALDSDIDGILAYRAALLAEPDNDLLANNQALVPSEAVSYGLLIEAATRNPRICPLFVLENDDQTIGGLVWGGVSVSGALPNQSVPLDLYDFGVEQNLRGSGAAQMLLTAIEDWARERRSFSSLIAQVSSRNARAIRFYTRSGFATTGTVNNQTQSGETIAWQIMEKPLAS
jgi:ribosomal protein S18 acetylase RimI-like enzyme